MLDLKGLRKDRYSFKKDCKIKHINDWKRQRFPQEAVFLLDQYIPNTTVEQLSKFMARKFDNIIRNCPIIEIPLKKVIRQRLTNLPQQLQKIQRQKIINYVKQKFPQYYFQQGKDTNTYIFKKIDCNVKNYRQSEKIQGWTIQYKNKSKITIKQQPVNKKAINIMELYKNQSISTLKTFASTSTIINQTFGNNRGNFEREAYRLLTALERFIRYRDLVQKQQE